jgi:hypothetical protein
MDHRRSGARIHRLADIPVRFISFTNRNMPDNEGVPSPLRN